MDALRPVPRWVNLPTSRARRLPQEPMFGASGDGRGRSRRFVQMPDQSSSRSSGLNMRQTYLWAFTQAVAPAQQSIPIPLVQGLHYNSLCT